MKLKDLIIENELLAGTGPNPEAGKNAPPEVQEAVERWRALPEEERRNKPLLYWLLGSGTPDYKMSPEESDYTDRSEVEGQTCDNCEFAYLKIANKKFICSQISGHIQPKGWCRLWKPKDEAN